MRVRLVYNGGANIDPCSLAAWGETEDYSVNIITLSDCNDADAGTISSSVTEACGGDTFTINSSGTTAPGNGLIFQWQESPSGLNNWTNITGANSANLTVSGLSGDTDYRLKVNCSFGNLEDISNVVTVNQSPATSCYCTPPAPSFNDLYWIAGVITTGGSVNINNTGTTHSPGGYIDYSSAHQVGVFPGTTFDLEVQSQNGSSAGIKVWIDWNQNGAFEASELVYSDASGSTSSLNTYNTTIQVPANAQLGTTRMRIRNYTNQEPCNQLSYGETEDYGVIVQILSDCNDAVAGTISSSQSQVCADENYSLTVSGATMPGNGMTYQWQESPAGQNTWTDITGATNMSYTTNGLTDATDYRLIVSCSFGNLSDTSNVTTVNPSPAMDCLCTPIYTSGCNIGARVDGVTTTMGITNISNTGTGCNEMDATGYTDYSSTHSASALQAAMMGIEVDVSNYSGGVKVWIDWNQNGVFEANELVTESSSTISAGISHSDNYIVHANAVPGNTRMRVRVVEGSTSFDPCGSASYGETEDYTFEVIQGTPCSGQPDLAAISGPTDVCPDVSFMLH